MNWKLLLAATLSLLLVSTPVRSQELRHDQTVSSQPVSSSSASRFSFLLFIGLCPLLWLADLISQRQQSKSPSRNERVIRGMRLGKQVTTNPPAKLLETPWGPDVIPWGDDCRHQLGLGNTGQGKSTWMEVMMVNTLPAVGSIQGYGAIIVDPKRTLVPLLEGLRIPFWIANPLDKRSIGWCVGADITNELQAQEFVRILLEHDTSDNENSEYFDNAALDIVTGLVVSCIYQHGRNWQLYHLTESCRNEETMKAMLQHHPHPEDFEDYFKKSKNPRNDVVTTIKTKISRYNVIARLWRTAATSISMAEVVQGGRVLILGSDYEFPGLINQVNKLMFHVLAARLKNRAGDNAKAADKPRFRVFIDEAQAIGRMVELENLLALGRSGAISVTIATQNISGWIKEYGDENLVKSIWELCLYKAFFGMGSASAKWVSDQLGTYDAIRINRSVNVNQGNFSFGFNQQYETRPTLTAQELMDTHPFFNVKERLAGYWLAPYKGIVPHSYSWEQINQWLSKRRDDIPPYDRISDDDPRLR